MKYEDSPEPTVLSRYVWSKRKAGKEDPNLEWSDDCRAPHYRSGSKVCDLCNLETYKIAICPRKYAAKPIFRATEELHLQILRVVELKDVGKPGLIDDRRPH